jgi:hypothetical protein
MAGKITDRSLGVFDTRALVGAFDPKISEFKLSEPRFGANLQAMYLYGGMHSDSGKFYVVERKFLSSMTGGLFIMSNQGGSMELDPGSPRSGRGEVRREFDDTSMRWHEPIMQRIPEELRVAEEQPLDLRVTDDEFRWSEGNLLDLSGPMPSVGLQFVAPMKGQLLVYQSQCYWLKGTLLGEEAEGPIFFDHIFWTPHGLEWKETPMYTDRQVSWTIFGNKLDDGATQFGHLISMTGGMAVAAIAEDRDPMVLSDRVDLSFELDADSYVTRATHDVEGQRWIFTEDADGHMEGHSKARWGEYRAQSGQVRLEGETREVTKGFTWVECFADRIRAEGLVK